MSCDNCTCADKLNVLTIPYEDTPSYITGHTIITKDAKLKGYLDVIGKEIYLGPKKRKILSVKVTEHYIHVEFEPLCK